jgi:hypothetical protein
LRIFDKGGDGGAEGSGAEGGSRDRVPKQALREFSIAADTERMRFVSGSNGLPTLGEWRGRPATGDLDRDGNLDIVASVRKGDGLHVFYGDGKGNWTERGEPFPPNLGYGGSDLGDFDGDGNLDIVFSTHGAPIQVFLGDGAGGWTHSSEGCANDQIIEDVAVADFDRDGNPDIVGIGWAHGGLYLFMGDGKGRWATFDPFPGDDDSFGHEIVAGDIDGDGNPDFAVTMGGPKVFLGDGNGKFRPANNGLPVPPTKGTCWGIGLGDVTGNGRLEIAVAFTAMEGMRGLAVYGMDDEGNWISLSEGLPRVTTFLDAEFGDVDGDGEQDLVAFAEEHVLIWRGNGGHTWTPAGMVGNFGRAGNVAIADVNGDGRNDIVVVHQHRRAGIQALLQL